MSVNYKVSYFLDRFDFPVPQQLGEKYYRYKLGHPCFLMKQNGRWTIVPVRQ